MQFVIMRMKMQIKREILAKLKKSFTRAKTLDAIRKMWKKNCEFFHVCIK